MKKLIILLVIAVMNVTFVSAKILDPRKSYASTDQELSCLLKSSSANGLVEFNEVVVVKFLVTETSDIVVLNAATENKKLAEYIKEKLNYRKFTTNELTAGHSYEFEINFNSL